MDKMTRLELSNQMCKNIYYMLCYAADELKYMSIGDIRFEDTSGIDDLLAILMLKAYDIWEADKPSRGYKRKENVLDHVRGSIEAYESYVSGALYRGKIICKYFELDIDTDVNRVIKLAMNLMIKRGDNVSNQYRNELLLRYRSLNKITLIDIKEYYRISRKRIESPIYYKPILSASKIVIESVLASNNSSEQLTELFKLEDDKRYQYIFEKFVRNFYKDTFKNAETQVGRHKHVVADTYNINRITKEPDVEIAQSGKALIIDTKWYTGDANSSNISQIITYATLYVNTQRSKGITDIKDITGVLLYAKNVEDSIDSYETMPIYLGNTILNLEQKVINMDDNFESIKANLLKIVTNVFGEEILKGVSTS